MSLIALTSDGQNPSIFQTHFPQPIQLSTRSQVCLQKFIHFRDSSTYNVSPQNNTLYFVLGNTQFDGKRKVVLPPNEYQGDDLAKQIAKSMNAVTQQQNFEWECVYIKKGTTTPPATIPATEDTFEISYKSLVTPDERGGSWDDNGNELITLNNDDAVGKTSSVEFIGFEAGVPSYIYSNKGVLVHNGEITTSNIAYDINNNGVDNRFGEVSIGCMRDELYLYDSGEPDFTDIMDIQVTFKYNIIVSIAKQTQGVSPGNPNWINSVIVKTIPNIYYNTWTEDSQKEDVRFKTTLTLNQSSKRALIQLYFSTDKGTTYTAVPETTLTGNPALYISKSITIAATTYDGCIYDSATAVLADNNTTTQNLIQSKRCPYIPTISYGSIVFREGLHYFFVGTEFASGNAARNYTFGNYTGANDFDIVLTRIAPPTPVQTYYMKYSTTTLRQLNGWYADEANIDPLSPDFVFQQLSPYAGDSGWTFIEAPGGDTWNIFPSIAMIIHGQINKLELSGIFDGELRNVSSGLKNTPSYLEGKNEHARIAIESDRINNEVIEHTPIVELGADISKTAGLWLRPLDSEDIEKYKNAPLNLKTGDTSGTIGNLIGSEVNVIATDTDTNGIVWTSTQEPEKYSLESTLHISVNEFPMVKSYEGGNNTTAKSIAIIPREEFTSGEDTNSLVYVAPFENWIDLNNKEMGVNVFSMEVRRPNGTIATDLRPNTYAVMKIRQDPAEREAQEKQAQFDKLALALSSAVQSGQILSNQMDTKSGWVGS